MMNAEITIESGSSPEKELWRKVLESAYRDLVTPAGARCYTPKRERGHVYYSPRQKAEMWIYAEDAGAGSFIWVCEMWDLDVKIMRDRARQLTRRGSQ